MGNLCCQWKIFGLQLSCDLRQSRSSLWISHSFLLMWIKLLSRIFVSLVSAPPERRRLWNRKHLETWTVIRFESEEEFLVCEVTTRYHSCFSQGHHWPIHRMQCWIGHQQLFVPKQTFAFRLPPSVLSEAFSGAVTVRSNWCWQCSQMIKKRGSNVQ